MTDPVSRRDWLKTMGVVGAGALVTPDALRLPATLAGQPAPLRPAAPPHAALPPGSIVDLSSTSEIFIPPRGRGFMKFSFDFPEPSVVFADLRFGFLVFTGENTYGLDRTKMSVSGSDDALRLTCTGFVWAGGQEKAPGTLTATLRRIAGNMEWDTVVEMEQPVKTVTTIIRGVPRGQVSLGGGRFIDPKDNEMLAGYPFAGGDLNGPGGSMNTPLLMIQAPSDVFFVSSLDHHVRPKRFYLAPGEASYRVEAIHEHDAWRDDRRVTVPTWRLGRAPTSEAAESLHVRHVEQAYGLRPWETRTDVPAWLREIALATTLHGMHYTGYMFNDYSKMLETLRWMRTQIPGDRVLVFLSAWDGRYYWEYPNYRASDRMGGETGFRRLVDEGRQMGFRIMPMFGANAANRKLPSWPKIADAMTRKIDGNAYYLDWVDWNNDRHQDAWGAYMNLGADSWRQYLEGRITEVIDRYHVDAYFLDIVGGHVNSTNGDMHEGTRMLIEQLRAKYPQVACVGEMPYDALHGFIPMFQVGLGPVWGKYGRSFSHLSSPAPGRGSSGVHESGFGRFNEETLGLYPNTIPTLQVVDDTFANHRDVMAEIIRRARQRAGIT
ncbi:MAG TPA: hypothetical protein VJU87_02235 [Gemmatimonadaceae bacterium]|nr:hypothetical protein [Gemmatimonadaceae bacterium]